MVLYDNNIAETAAGSMPCVFCILCI